MEEKRKHNYTNQEIDKPSIEQIEHDITRAKEELMVDNCRKKRN